MPSSWMLRLVALVRTDVSEQRITIIRVTKICELGTLAIANNRSKLRGNTSVASVDS
jgi:hypothetical protein